MLTWKVEAVVTVTLWGGVWRRGYTGRVALLEGGGRGRRRGSGGGRITAGVQLIQRWRLILPERNQLLSMLYYKNN